MFTVSRNARGYDLFDDGGCLVDTAPSLDWLRGYVRGLSDYGSGYRNLDHDDVLEAFAAINFQEAREG
jgi:hypothetical protein